MEIRLVIDDELMNSLKIKSRAKTFTEVIREALGILDWAIDEAGRGRIILSVNEDGENPTRIETPALRNARK